MPEIGARIRRWRYGASIGVAVLGVGAARAVAVSTPAARALNAADVRVLSQPVHGRPVWAPPGQSVTQVVSTPAVPTTPKPIIRTPPVPTPTTPTSKTVPAPPTKTVPTPTTPTTKTVPTPTTPTTKTVPTTPTTPTTSTTKTVPTTPTTSTTSTTATVPGSHITPTPTTTATTPTTTAPATTVVAEVVPAPASTLAATPAAISSPVASPAPAPAATPTSAATTPSPATPGAPAVTTHGAARAQRRSSHGRSARSATRRTTGATGASGSGSGGTSTGRATGTRVATAGTAAPAGGTAAASGTSTVSTGPVHRRHRHVTPPSSSAVPPTLGQDLSHFSGVVGRYLPVPLPVPDWSKPIILILLLISGLLAARTWRTSRRSRRLESQRKQLATDLATLQAALVSDIPPSVGALDVSVAYAPAEGLAAGGDFYDAFTLDAGRVAIIVGDVSGHGRTALGRAAQMRYTLRAYVEMGLEPRAALKLAGRVLGAEEDDLFTTVVVAVFDPAAGTLTYASAGHPAPVVLGGAAHHPLRGSASPPLGWGAPTGRRQTTVGFGEGDRACFFTDGVTEARVNGGLLGRAGLVELLADCNAGEPAAALLEHLRDRAQAIHDDMAACVVAPTAGTARAGGRVEELEVDLRQLAAGQGDRFLNACGVAGDEADIALAEARRVAIETGTAVMRVELGGAVGFDLAPDLSDISPLPLAAAQEAAATRR